MQSITTNTTSSRNILNLSFNLCLRLLIVFSFKVSPLKFCIYHLFRTCYMPRLSHPPWFDRPDNIWLRVQIMTFIICGFFHFISLHVFCLVSTQLSHTLNECSSLTVRDQQLHQYKTKHNIIVLHSLICWFLDTRREDGIHETKMWTCWRRLWLYKFSCSTVGIFPQCL
jgi:hypothetical protein